MEVILTIIALLLAVLISVIYEVKKAIKEIPSTIYQMIIGSMRERMDDLNDSISKIKDDLGMD